MLPEYSYYSPDTDFNGSNSVSGADLLVLRKYFGGVPGPSGLVP